MTLEQAHKMLDEEYAKNEVVQIGFRQGKIPNNVRVASALIAVAEKAKAESSFFSMPRVAESEEIHCNCTDEEIAKSFIEDVEAVKELLPRESEE